LANAPTSARASGFSIIATANTRDRGVNEMSAALKRRFNFVTVPVVDDLEQEIRIVKQREAQLRSDYQVGTPPPDELTKLLVTVFQELRSGASKDGKTKVRHPEWRALECRGHQRAVQQRHPGPKLWERGGGRRRTPQMAAQRCSESQLLAVPGSPVSINARSEASVAMATCTSARSPIYFGVMTTPPTGLVLPMM
jgi:hypothetical protein